LICFLEGKNQSGVVTLFSSELLIVILKMEFEVKNSIVLLMII
jgi:hypothetical protein